MNLSEEIDTAVRQPRISKESPRPKSKTKTRKKGTSPRSKSLPYRGVGSTTALQTSKNNRDLWLTALRGETGKKNKGVRRSTSEAWTEALRRSGSGVTSGTMGRRDNISNLKKLQTENMSYSSTSHFLRQAAGLERTGKTGSDTAKSAPGTPAYKSKEEYYDEVLALKKQIQQMNAESSTLKLKIRRIEEDNLKKEKEIEQLLDPSKSGDMRRTLTDRRPDSSAVVHSLKQKNLKLEQQVKEKEAALTKLQSDVKTTKLEEMKVEVNTFYQEIIRLNQLKTGTASPGQLSETSRKPVKESPSKIKALQENLLRMRDQNVRLQRENTSLKQDLDQLLQQHADHKEKSRDYKDMSRKDLVGAVAKLEKRLDRAEDDALSISSQLDNRKNVEGKIVLEGSLAQKLEQLDRRETELLEEISKQKTQIRRLKDDRTHYRKKCDEKDREIKSLKKDLDQVQAELDGFYDRDKTPRSARVTPRSTRTTPRRSSTPTSVSSAEKERLHRAERLRETNAARKIQRGYRAYHDRREDERKSAERQRKLDELSRVRAARTIQRQWRYHQQEEREMAEAAEVIQSAFRGHSARQANLSRMRGYMAEEEEDTTEGALSDSDDHRGGHSQNARSSLRYDSPRLSTVSQRSTSPKFPYNSPRSTSPKFSYNSPRSLSPSTLHRASPALSSQRGSIKGKSRQTSEERKKSRTPTPSRFDSDDDDDDDDDIIMPSSGKKLF